MGSVITELLQEHEWVICLIFWLLTGSLWAQVVQPSSTVYRILIYIMSAMFHSYSNYDLKLQVEKNAHICRKK